MVVASASSRGAFQAMEEEEGLPDARQPQLL
jgi:hypothetical protein